MIHFGQFFETQHKIKYVIFQVFHQLFSEIRDFASYETIVDLFSIRRRYYHTLVKQYFFKRLNLWKI